MAFLAELCGVTVATGLFQGLRLVFRQPLNRSLMAYSPCAVVISVYFLLVAGNAETMSVAVATFLIFFLCHHRVGVTPALGMVVNHSVVAFSVVAVFHRVAGRARRVGALSGLVHIKEFSVFVPFVCVLIVRPFSLMAFVA